MRPEAVAKLPRELEAAALAGVVLTVSAHSLKPANVLSCCQRKRRSRMTGPSQSHGTSEHIQGEVKKNTLGLFSHEQKAKGQAQSAAGTAEKDTARAKDYASGAKSSFFGGIRKNFGKLFHNRSQQAKGASQQAKGNAQKAINA